MTNPFIEKYRAKSFSDIKGQDSIISEVETFFKTFPRKKALILNGPVGTGKTSIAIALADKYNLELFELNASDLRNRISLDEILRPSITQKSLFKKSKLILMDEADGITTSDRGGLPELLVLIDKTNFPIIITSNDIWNRKFNLLRKKSHVVNIKELSNNVIISIINNILEKEKKKLKLETLNLIAKKARGDARAALNDLQSVLSVGEDEFTQKISERDKEESIFNILKKIFQESPDENIINIYDNANLELNEISLWVEENIPLEYHGIALAKAFESLSKSDLFKGRIYRQQHWRFLVYQNFFLSAGISSAAKIKNKGFTKYQRPSRVLKIWLANQRDIKKKSIIMKYAKLTHMSKKKAMKESFFLPLILDKWAQKKLDLDDKEKEYLKEKKGTIIVNNELNKFRI